MSDANYGLDGNRDDWNASYDSPTGPESKNKPMAAASSSPADPSSTPSYLSDNSSSTTPPASSTSLYAPAPASTPSANPATPTTAAPDPVAADQQARSVANSLQAAGHQVSWNGNQLMVDGRPYDVTAGYPVDALLGGTGTGGSSSTPQKPTGGNFRDPSYAAQYVAYMASQPGSNPSLKNDPNYWIGKLTSGELGSDASYIDQKMMAPEGAPAGGGGAIDTGLVPSYAQVSSVGDPSALMPNIAMPAAPWGDAGVPTYQPGAITFNDIPDFTPDSLRAQMNSGGASSSLDSLIKNIEDNPTSLDEHTVDTMKAQMKDTLAEQGQLEDSMTKGQAGALGIGDSPWLASERAAARRSTGQAIATGGQNIDIEAGKTRQAQKLASASAGQAYQNARSQQVMDTVNAGLQRATVTGNRMALRESVAQAAAKSKQDAFQIQADWLSKQTGQQISAASLRQQGQEFSENLMMQIAGANVGVQEFGANYGLGAASLQHTMDNDAWNHTYLDEQNLTPTA